MADFFDNIPAAPLDFDGASHEPGNEPLAQWRSEDVAAVATKFADPEFVARACELAANARPAARALRLAWIVCEAAARRPGAPARDARGREGADSLATDLLVTVLLIEAFGGDPAASSLVEALRRRRRLPALRWPAGPRSGPSRPAGKARPRPRESTRA